MSLSLNYLKVRNVNNDSLECTSVLGPIEWKNHSSRIEYAVASRLPRRREKQSCQNLSMFAAEASEIIFPGNEEW